MVMRVVDREYEVWSRDDESMVEVRSVELREDVQVEDFRRRCEEQV